MEHKDYDRLSNLAALTELPGERDQFLESLIPFYEMMEKVRNAVLEEDVIDCTKKSQGDECVPGTNADETSPMPGEDEPALILREDLPRVYDVPKRILEQSERRDGAYFTVPRSI